MSGVAGGARTPLSKIKGFGGSGSMIGLVGQVAGRRRGADNCGVGDEA